MKTTMITTAILTAVLALGAVAATGTLSPAAAQSLTSGGGGGGGGGGGAGGSDPGAGNGEAGGGNGGGGGESALDFILANARQESSCTWEHRWIRMPDGTLVMDMTSPRIRVCDDRMRMN